MAKSHLAVWGAASVLAVCLLVGAPVAFSAGDATIGPAWLWWVCYLGFLGLFTVALLDDAPRRTGRWAVLLALAAAGAATVLLGAQAAWLAILLVFGTAIAAYRTTLRNTAVLLVFNGLVAGAAPLLRDGTVMDVVLTAALYTMLQVCTVWAVRSERREAAARERLAVANTELRAATALLAESSRSAERLRISRELHDLLGHQLTALVLELEVAAHHSTPPAAAHVARARGLARDLLGDVRTAVGELRARTTPLHHALAEVVADLPHPRIHLSVAGGIEPDETRTAVLIRCVQEVVTNTVRHAEAENLWIDVGHAGNGEIVLTARDDGRGASALRLGNGLTGVRERVAQLDGEVSFATSPGFTVSARVPAP
ncbi:two-component sensor histidine kinase [Actinomadura sp. GC306]|uniref:sensor histidine kinase n=1 Tax=Actinomadura sp. GC306 TaxID=2530367 RepID=UPI00104F1367|nr:histidine kinase [Actinomadura sp. GC306]TDC70942.1 two-component sensor histidine kinase [Actinomadura sp. GC306]